MEATLKIYNSIQDKEPSKVFTCYRTTIAINNRLEELTDEINLIQAQINKKAALVTSESSPEEVAKIRAEIKPLEEQASQLTFESVKIFFPDFTEQDFMLLDPYDWQTFCLQIGAMRGKIYNRAQKN